jgi:hypothetical protein
MALVNPQRRDVRQKRVVDQIFSWENKALITMKELGLNVVMFVTTAAC